MYSLILGIFFAVWAVCDLLDVKILAGNAMSLADRKRKSFRRWRGVLWIFTALAAGWVWYVEIILRRTVLFPEALLIFGLPYAIPVVGVVILNRIYGVPLFQKS